MRKIGILIGVDGGILNMGIAVLLCLIDAQGNLHLQVLYTKVFHTYPADKKHKDHTYASDDLSRRLNEIGDFFEYHLLSDHVIAVCMEDISNVTKNAKAANQLNAVFGVITEATRKAKIPLYRESPKAIKKKLTGKTTASKEEVEEAVTKIFNYSAWEVVDEDVNHCADAIGAAFVCINHPLVLQSIRTTYLFLKQNEEI